MPKNLLENDELTIAFFENPPEQIAVKFPGTEDYVPLDSSLVVGAVVPTELEKLQNCPRCNKPLVPAMAVSGSESVSFKECPECGTLINTFNPTNYQARFLTRPERYKMTAGGYGSGKSRSNIEDVIKHLLLVPSARVCVAARTYPALEGTFVKEFYSMFPNKLVRRKNDQKHEVSLTNGSEILFRSFDDETKLKSMNLTMAVIVEASDVNYNAFTMLQSRIRNTTAMLPEVDAEGNPIMEYDPQQHIYRPKHRVDVRRINLETNPDSGWVKKFLLDSGTVEFFGDAYNEAYRYNPNPDPNKYTQIVSTSANPYLPEGYEEEQTRGKSKAYIQQFYKGSFNFSSNLVFPNFGTCIVNPHPLPRAFNEEGRRVLFFVIGVDYGINDPTHCVFSAFSTETKKLYVFAEYRVNNSDIKTIAKGYRKEIRTNGTDLEGLLMLPKFDAKSYNKRESDLVSIGSMFEDEGLFFSPASASHEARIIKLNSLINHNQIEVYSTCEFLIEEILHYKFKLDRTGAPTSQPEDGRDHGITALEFSLIDLPHNLSEFHLKAYLPPGTKILHDRLSSAIIKKEKQVYNPLAEEPTNARNPYSNRLVNDQYYSPRSTSLHYGVVSPKDDEEDEDRDERGISEGIVCSAFVPGDDRY